MDTTETKIIFALEKLISVFRSHIWKYAHQHKISPIQIQFLKYLKEKPLSFCTVSNLSNEFALTKATVSDAVKSLIKKGYVKRISDKNDSRKTWLTLTKKGQAILSKLDSLNDIFISTLNKFPDRSKENFLLYLMDLLRLLVTETKTPILRMCITCENFDFNRFPNSDTPHYCKFLNLKMTARDLRIDCTSNRKATEFPEEKLRKMETLFS